MEIRHFGRIADKGGFLMTTAEALLTLLRIHANPDNVAGMARFGINPAHTLGVPVATLRTFARQTGRDHALALALWASGIHEARILAALVDEPKKLTEAQMDSWVRDFDSWDVCDQVCSNLFDKTPLAYDKAAAWSAEAGEFVKRAGFVLMAMLAVHDKQAPDERFLAFLPLIEREAGDERNFVKKAVNWALRQIGKRNATLHPQAVSLAAALKAHPARAARWVGADALRELSSAAVEAKIKKRAV